MKEDNIKSPNPHDLQLSSLVALSIRQPWAWLIVNGHKIFENREWNAKNPGRKFRGYALLHAAKGMTEDEYWTAYFEAHRLGVKLPAEHELERGGIVGVAKFDQWHDEPPRMRFAFTSGFELSSIHPLPYRPCIGKLGFFKPEVDWDAPIVAPEIRCKCGWQGLKNERAEKPLRNGVRACVCPACGRREAYLIKSERVQYTEWRAD